MSNPWQPWKAGTTHCASANPHRHTERNSVETTYLNNTYLDQEQKGKGGAGVQESAMIRKQSSATDPQQSAEYTTTIMQ